MPSQKPTERPQSHARRRGYRNTTKHANAAQKATEGAQNRARKMTDRPTRSSSTARMGLFRSLFVLFRRELVRMNFTELIFDLLKSPFCDFSENEKVYFLNRFPHLHRQEAHRQPQNPDTAAAPLPGLLLRREGCSA